MPQWPELPPGVRVFLITVLPSTHFKLWKAVKGWQRDFSKDYGSHSSKNKPPHITLVLSFELHEDLYLELINALKSAASLVSPGKVSVRDFDHFGKRTLFLKIIKSDWIVHLQRQFHLAAAKVVRKRSPQLPLKPGSFHPHMTLGYRDLSPDQFDRAWERFSQMRCETEFAVNCVYLLRWSVEERRWKKDSEFFLKGPELDTSTAPSPTTDNAQLEFELE